MLRVWVCWEDPPSSFRGDVAALGEDAKGVFFEFFRAYLRDPELAPGMSISGTNLRIRWLLGGTGSFYGLLYEGTDDLGSQALGLRMFYAGRHGTLPDMERAMALDRLQTWRSRSGDR